MAFTKAEHARNQRDLEWFLGQRRPPEHLRDKLDIAYSEEGHTIDLFEIRPHWDDRTTTYESPIARIRFVRTQNLWRLYWMRRDLKWHGYEPGKRYSTLMSALREVDIDEYCCFFG